MHSRDRSLLAILLTALVALVLAVVVVGQAPASSRAAVTIAGPATATPKGKVTVQVRVAKGIRGKVVVQARRGARWVDLAKRRLPSDGQLSIGIAAPASGGGFQLRAKVGSRTSKPLTITVKPKAKPTPSESPLPELPAPTTPSDEDARCKAQFGYGKRVLESEHKVRPLGWPQTQPWAVLCRLVKVSENEEYGCYATDPGTKIYDVLWYYDHAIVEPGVADYAPVPGELILTGVVGDSSFWIEQDAFDQFKIVWARDGEYEEDASLAC
jgi:hypothetical protein